MPRGGARPGAGRRKGSTVKIPYGRIAELYGERILELGQQFINDKDPETRRWAWEHLLPYVFSKAPLQQVPTARSNSSRLTILLPEKQPPNPPSE
jgi:hypothetical protein